MKLILGLEKYGIATKFVWKAPEFGFLNNSPAQFQVTRWESKFSVVSTSLSALLISAAAYVTSK